MCNEAVSQQLIKWRRMFHRNPELSNQEKQTSNAIAGELEKMAVPFATFTRNFGLCAVIKGVHPGPIIAFRADMDALPIPECSQAAYCSQNSGIMHACGHDGHMAVVLGLAQMFMSVRSKLAGTIKLIFQPAEEDAPTGGASRVLSSGVLDDVSAIFGLHVWPDAPCGEIGIRVGSMMAASDRLTIRLKGKSSHAGKPQQGVDAITMAADVLEGLGHIVSRQLNPLSTATISIGTMHCGERYNVVADNALLEGTVRTLDESIRREMPKKIERLLAGMTTAQGGDYDLKYQFGYPILTNWPEPTKLVITAAQKIIGKDSVHTDVHPELTAEDFSRYLEKLPGAFFWLGCKKDGDLYGGLHNPTFDMDESALFIGMKILYHTGLLALVHYNK
ncbi:M20 family metallopeptidase [Pectinatus frisingensis]|uniref:M20 metallopeptidase family protein n=1 Tax=Pectinatus frisingensis TaxID=865 RepID=UPI002EDAAF32